MSRKFDIAINHWIEDGLNKFNQGLTLISPRLWSDGSECRLNSAYCPFCEHGDCIDCELDKYKFCDNEYKKFIDNPTYKNCVTVITRLIKIKQKNA